MTTSDKHYPPDGRQCPHKIEGHCNSCTPQSEELKKEWEISFEKMEKYHGWIPEHKERIKSFISSLLAKQQEEFVKMIPKYANSVDLLSIEEFGERARITNLLNENMVVGYNQCIADIKSKLNNTEREK